MTLIVSDTSPLHYLALIGEIQILPALYGRIIIPEKVFDELQQPNTPSVIKNLISALPSWLEVRAITTSIDASLSHLDRGEQEAITLAIELQAERGRMSRNDICPSQAAKTAGRFFAHGCAASNS